MSKILHSFTLDKKSSDLIKENSRPKEMSKQVSKAIECLGANKKVSISDYKIGNIVCGKPSLQGSSPNPAMSCDFISIDKECFDEIS